MKLVRLVLCSLGVAIMAGGLAHSESLREKLHIVGSSTVYPLVSRAADQFSADRLFSRPVIESTGTSRGFERFCAGAGLDTPDINTASRRISAAELAMCERHGVSDVVEIPLGFDGIVLATGLTGPKASVSRRDIYRAIAAILPTSDEDCTPIENPYTRWSQIDPALPDLPIEVFGPPESSGTRDIVQDLILKAGAESYRCVRALKDVDRAAYQRFVSMVRRDGHWIDGGEHDQVLANTVATTPGAAAIMGFATLAANRDTLRAIAVEDVEPQPTTISDRRYPLTRPLYAYVKAAHLGRISGLREFVQEMASDRASGRGGYLTYHGLIPLTAEGRTRATDAAIAMRGISRSDLVDEPGKS